MIQVVTLVGGSFIIKRYLSEQVPLEKILAYSSYVLLCWLIGTTVGGKQNCTIKKPNIGSVNSMDVFYVKWCEQILACSWLLFALLVIFAMQEPDPNF